MKIKTKLNLGLGLLFCIIILMAVASVKQIYSLAQASENILKDNKETLDYTRNMLKCLSELPENKNALKTFEDYLSKQKKNITEIGEQEITANLIKNFESFKQDNTNETIIKNLQSDIFRIMELNLVAIENKNTIAESMAQSSVYLISFSSIMGFLVALFLLIKLPSNISNPINELILSIKKIAENDYSQRVYFENHSEFGELAAQFNKMATQLEEYNRSNISKILAEKKITETLINKRGVSKNFRLNISRHYWHQYP